MPIFARTKRLALPRVIVGNRGDLASRWGVLQAFDQLGMPNVTVWSMFADEVPALPYRRLHYSPVRNLLPRRASLEALRKADVAVWAVGLDLQDDSSLVKLAYLLVTFRLYRSLGLRICCLFQGAGPISTPVGFTLARRVLRYVDLFVARDPGTYRLIGAISPQTSRLLAHDAIFLPGFEHNAKYLAPADFAWLGSLTDAGGRPVVGFNIRQWFHFSSSIVPYQFGKQKYRERSLPQMHQLLQSAEECILRLRRDHAARVLLLSAYQPGVAQWEDDLPWLRQLKTRFSADPEVQVVERSMTLPLYFELISRLQVMIGMRLHSALIALRLGVPAINLSYTLKGADILAHLGLSANVIDLEEFIQHPDSVVERTSAILQNHVAEVMHARWAVERAISVNMDVLRTML